MTATRFLLARLRPTRRALIPLLAAAVVAGGLAVPTRVGLPSAHATGVTVSTNPATVSSDVNQCPQTAYGPLCIYPHGYKILDPSIPIPAADADAVNAMQDHAVAGFLALHGSDTAQDPRIVLNGENEIRGLMWEEIQAAIATPGDQRTADQNHIYDWFQHVVQTYNVTAAKDALAEYKNWQARQCLYHPAAPTPAYNAGHGCDPSTSGTESLAEGAVTPTISQLEAWGGYEAAASLTNPHVSGQDFFTGSDVALRSSLLATDVLAAGATTAVGGLAERSSSLATELVPEVAANGLARVAEYPAGRAATAILEAIGSALGGATFAVVAAVVAIVLAVVALILAIAEGIVVGLLPGQLQGAIDAAQQLPDLSTMLNDSINGQPELYLLFLGQTSINNVSVPQSGAPDWHGDYLQVQSADTTVSPAVPTGPATSSKAVSLQTWGDKNNASTISFLTDLGWVESSVDGGASYLTTTTLNYKDWDGNERTAWLDDTDFIQLPGNGSTNENYSNIHTCSDKPEQCTLSATLQALDANGNKVYVTLQPERPVPATINASPTSYTEGVANSFTDPNSDPLGPTTYTWMFESRPLATAAFTLCQTGPAGCDNAFHGNPAVIETGQTVSYTWPSAGIFHVRLTTKNASGQTDVTDEDITVSGGSAPSINVSQQRLGPLGPGQSAEIGGCFTTAAGLFAKPTVTIDWGDGTTESAVPTSGAIFDSSTGTVIASTAPPQPFLVAAGGLNATGNSCTGSYSFTASHPYQSGPGNSGISYNITITVADGEGRTSNTALVAQVAPPVLTTLVWAPWNETNSTDGFTPGIPGGIGLYNDGDQVEFRLLFNESPITYGDSVTIDFGDGTETAYFDSCTIDGCTLPDDFYPTHTYHAKPGVPGTSLYTVTAFISNSDTTVQQFTTQVAINDVPPTITNLTYPGGVGIGQPVTVSGTVSSVNHSTPLNVTVEWAAPDPSLLLGPQTQTITLPPLGARSSEDFSFTQAGFLTVAPVGAHIQVNDWSGGVTKATALFYSGDVNPVPSIDPSAGTEGQPLALLVHTGAPNALDYFETVDWGDGSSPQTTEYGVTTNSTLPTPDHTYANSGTYTVHVSLDDHLGGTGSTTTTVTIGHIPPTLTVDTGSGTAGNAITVHGTITETSTAATFTGTVDWQDGSPVQDFSEPAGTTTFSLDHTYAVGGTYAPAVRLTDSLGALSNPAIGAETITGPPVFTGVDTPSGVVVGASEGVLNEPYSFTFTAAGFPTPSFDLQSGTLPPGLTLDPSGILHGTPTTVGTFSYRVRATNSVAAVVVGISQKILAAGPATSLSVVTASSQILTGAVTDKQAFTMTATGSDGNGGTSDDTGKTKFTITNGTCQKNVCSSSSSGPQMVTGTFGALTGTASVVVAPTLIVTAPSPTATYGAIPIVFTPSYSGFVDAQTAPAIAPTCTSTATATSGVGKYKITCSGGSDPAYLLSRVAGTVTVAKATLQVTAPTTTLPYGPIPATFTPQLTGFVNGDSTVATTPTCTTRAKTGSAPKTYPITCKGGADPNYTFAYTSGTLTIVKAAVDVTESAPPVVNGKAVPVTVTVTPQIAGSPVPTGTVRVYAGYVSPSSPGVLVGTATLNSSGVATVAPNGTSPGKARTAVYAGNVGYLPAVSAPFNFTTA